MFNITGQTHTYNGLSHFSLFLTPAALAIGGLLWVCCARSGRDFIRDISQDSRHAVLVNSEPNQTKPMQIEIAHNGGSSELLVIDKVEFNGDRVWVRYKNVGDRRVFGISIGWMLKAPDGTILKHGSLEPDDDKGAYMLYPGESAALSGDISTDRSATICAVRIFWKTD